MESWRERGFVPDSDDEDAFDSQEKGVSLDAEGEGGDFGSGVEVEAPKGGNENGQDEEDRQPQDDAHSDELGSGKGTQDAVRDTVLVVIEKDIDLPLADGRPRTPVGDKEEEWADTGDAGTEDGHSMMDKGDSKSQEQEEDTADDDDLDLLPLPDGRPQTPIDDHRNGAGSRKLANIKNRSTQERRSSKKGKRDNPSSTPRAKQQRDYWDIPSSSPDLLQMDHHPWRKQTSPATTPTPKAQQASQPRPQEENLESSPLSSLSSVRSSILNGNNQHQPEEPRDQSLEDLLPLDIPEEILRELDPPTRRSFRQRNPIQLHPYLLEDAKYQKLMKARGIRPVRVAQQQQQAAAPAADESQGHSGEDAGSSSDTQMTGLQPPSSPLDFRQLFGVTSLEDTHESGDTQTIRPPRSPPNSNKPRSPKRRRVIGPEDNRPRQNLRPIPRPIRPQVVIDNASSSNPRDASSIFDIPSPPRSGSVSSPPVQHPKFRFPRGFEPPDITPRTETRRSTQDFEDEPVVIEDEPVVIEEDDSRSVRSASPHSNENSDIDDNEERENAQQAAVRRYQRKIKGVLPASWLRLDQQKQKGGPSAAQRNTDRMERLEAERAKGVAKKVTKKTNPVSSTARDHLSSLRHLADGSDEQSAEESDSGEGVEPSRPEASSFGLDDSFMDQDPDGDIPEDNRIDYMFPTMSRNAGQRDSRKPAKKRRREKTDGARSGVQSKKPRLKRQARLTDAGYGSQRKKRPSQNLPRLGILDAPDVASHSRKEQPQFLRVAARKARSRQDRGRRSPSRKVIRLNSRLDNEDANAPLREWRSGRMRQTTLPKVSTQTRRQPLKDRSTNARNVFNDLSTKRAERRALRQTAPDTANAINENDTVEDTPNTPAADPPSVSRPNAQDTATRPVQQRRGNAWIIQRNLAITSLSRSNPRPVIPEVESHLSPTTASASMQRSLALLGRDERLPLNRFLSAGTATKETPPTATVPDKPKPAAPHGVADTRRRQLKKRQPKRLEVTQIEDYAVPVSISPEPESTQYQSVGQLYSPRTSGKLSHFRTAYSVDFNISPLRPGIFFHESTFIGSADFSRSLDIAKRDLDKTGGPFTLTLGDQSTRWGAFDDSVSSQLGTAFDMMLENAEIGRTDGAQGDGSRNLIDTGSGIYRTLIKYVSEGLSFIDTIDRAGFVTRANSLVSKVMEDLSPSVSAMDSDTQPLVRIASHNVAFANQVCQVACHDLIDQSIQDETTNLAKAALKQVVTLASTSTGQEAVRKFLAASKRQDLREAGIKDDHPVVEAYVIVQHVLRSADRFKGCLEDFLTEEFSVKGVESTEKDIGGLEGAWQQLFTTLPLQEFDVLGISRIGSRFQGAHDNWTLVRRLLRPVFESDEANSESQPISYYSYCRVLFQRCFILINHWGWRGCKPILDTLYDFFAKRTLYNLRLEDSYKSPSFLDELDNNPSFEVLPGDPCFHILLKIIASGLRFLSKSHDKKKIRNYTWRLLPNHGRDYPKEQPIHQADLDALRNHHDLLCTLYSSVPDGCRPQLKTIKGLVNPATSHRETCKISLRTWARLIRFKLSTNEDISGLEPFAEWHAYFVTEFLKQHSLARREVEAQNDGGKQFSQQLIDSTVAQNQRQIETLLKTALQGMQSAIKCTPTLEHAQKIVSQTPIKSILDMFDSRTARLNATVVEGLHVILMYVQRCSLPADPQTTKSGNAVSADEDSQDYGWADIEAAYGYEPPPVPSGIEHVEKIFHPAVSRLVSNCFGEDRCPEDAILLSVVDCWTSIAHTLVRHGLRRWDSYISPYEGDSWMSLRWTTQTRKYTPLFLARCIEKDGEVLSECKVQILGTWLSSLVERVSMLKFQHVFTEAVLNRDAEGPLLSNLPFSRDPKEGRFSITFVDLGQRRLSLISSLLSNMRTHIQKLDEAKSLELSTTKQDYREVIQKMISSMKSNYQELGNGNAEARGSYVTFVHSIVGFLQQHTRDICPIDPFFTDPATFPPPENDPTYIVARLRGYEPKLSSAKVARTLINFIQGVSERAALDGTQTFLVNQLFDSMKRTYEGGKPDQPTLRATLLQGVFPAYLATTFDNPASWILSRAIIETIIRVFKELLFNIDTTDPDCVSSVKGIFHAVFDSSYKALHRIVINTNMLDQPPALKITSAFLEMITSTLPVIDYIGRLDTADTNSTQHLIVQMRSFQQFALFAVSNLQDPLQQSDSTLGLTPPIEKASTSPIDAISVSATRELQTYINESWSHHQGKYYFTRRGQAPQEVRIEVPIAAELENHPEKGLIDAASVFLDSLDRFDLFGEGGSQDVSNYLRLQTPSDNVSGISDELLLL